MITVYPLVVAVAMVVALAGAHPALADLDIKLASKDPRGGGADRLVDFPFVSPDGRYVTFRTDANDLVPNDRNGPLVDDVFRHDTVTGIVVRVSVDRDGGDANGASSGGDMSEDGRYVAFSSYANDLVPNDQTHRSNRDVFVRDMLTGTTVRVSVDADGHDADDESVGGSISWDGRLVAFSSDATDLVPGDGNDQQDIFIRDLETGTTTRVSVDAQGGDADSYSSCGSISGDGRYVAFLSEAGDLVEGEPDGIQDVFVRNLEAGTTIKVSLDTQGGSADTDSQCPKITGDARYVTFESSASDLVEGDGNHLDDIFVRDLVTGTTVRASVDVNGRDANGESDWPSISEDGRYVAFGTEATDMIPGDQDGTWDEVVVRDLVGGLTIRIAEAENGGEPAGSSYQPSISADGSVVAFYSHARDLVRGLERVNKPQVYVARWF